MGDYPGECGIPIEICWNAEKQIWEAPPTENAGSKPDAVVTPSYDQDERIQLLAYYISNLASTSSLSEVGRNGIEGAMTAEAVWNAPSLFTDGRAALKAWKAARSAAAEAGEVPEILAKAGSSFGNQTIKASSRAAAEEAAEKWVGTGARAIRAGRGTGDIIGEISADGQRVARFTSAGKAQPYINLENKATGGNLHVHF